LTRVVLAGNNLAAQYTFDVLCEAFRPQDLVVIGPHGDSRPTWQASLTDHAAARGVEVIAPPDVNAPDVLDRIAEHAPDLLLSVYYTQIFRDLLQVGSIGTMLNFHPSRLPRHRGIAPLIWAIAEGDKSTALTVHHIDSGIDTGPIVLQWPLPIHRRDTGYSLHLKMAKLVRAATATLVREFLDTGRVPEGRAQTGSATYHSRSDPLLNHLDWSLPRERVRNIVRALAPPLPGAYTMVEGERLVLVHVEAVEHSPEAGERPPGMVEIVGDSPRVWAGDGPVRLVEHFDGAKPRPGAELVASGRLREGQILA
jgi:methionyl-tRNA formyltransferase